LINVETRNDVSITEADTNSVDLVFTVSLSAPSGKTVTVNYGTASGTATALDDFQATSGLLTFPPELAQQTVHVEILGDPWDEPDEDLFVQLATPANATISDGQGRGVIVDNDVTPTVSIDSGTAAKAGQPAHVTLRLTATSTQTITVLYATVNGTAVAGTDFTATSGMATFTPDQLTQTVDVQTTADAPERDETFTLRLSHGTNVTIRYPDGTGTIRNRRKGDLNGDGNPDLLWQHTDGRLEAWFMSGVTKIGSAALASTASGWAVVGLGDFNADGMQDVVFEHTAGTLKARFLTDTTQLSEQSLTPSSVTDANWRITGVGDLNGDGQPDLYWQHQTNGQLAVWLMNGTTETSGSSLNPNQVADTAWQVQGVDTLNADTQVDLVWQHLTSNQLSAWLMSGLTQSSGPSLTPSTVTSGWVIRAVVDLNVDGHPDLVFQNSSTGLVTVWLMNELVQSSGEWLSPTGMGESGWTLVSPK
jgi:hypothetical protein